MSESQASSLRDFTITVGPRYSYRSVEAGAFLRDHILPAFKALGDQQSAAIIERADHEVIAKHFDEGEHRYDEFEWIISVPPELFEFAAPEDDEGNGILEHRITTLGFPVLDSVSGIRVQLSLRAKPSTQPIPKSAICGNGHVISTFIYDERGPQFCGTCGATVRTTCSNPNCNKSFPAVAAPPGQIKRYDSFCVACGTAYPWREKGLKRARRAIEEESEIAEWNTAAKERAQELISAIDEDSVDGPSIVRGVEWLGQRGAEGARSIIWDAVKSIGSDTLQAFAKAHGIA